MHMLHIHLTIQVLRPHFHSFRLYVFIPLLCVWMYAREIQHSQVNSVFQWFYSKKFHTFLHDKLLGWVLGWVLRWVLTKDDLQKCVRNSFITERELENWSHDRFSSQFFSHPLQMCRSQKCAIWGGGILFFLNKKCSWSSKIVKSLDMDPELLPS